MSGKKESANAELKRLTNELDQWLDSKRLIRVGIVSTAYESYMRLSPDDIRRLDQKEANEGAFILYQYGHYIQEEINRLSAMSSICKGRVRDIVGDKIAGYEHIYGMDERWLAAINDNDVARQWADLERRIIIRIERLAYLPQYVRSMADALRSIGYGKKSYA